MLSEKELKEAEGPSGWTAQQGFYVYRNKRLLVAGGWLGLAKIVHGIARNLIGLLAFVSIFQTRQTLTGKLTSENRPRVLR